jgi:hypothetical protein
LEKSFTHSRTFPLMSYSPYPFPPAGFCRVVWVRLELLLEVQAASPTAAAPLYG